MNIIITPEHELAKYMSITRAPLTLCRVTRCQNRFQATQLITHNTTCKICVLKIKAWCREPVADLRTAVCLPVSCEWVCWWAECRPARSAARWPADDGPAPGAERCPASLAGATSSYRWRWSMCSPRFESVSGKSALTPAGISPTWRLRAAMIGRPSSWAKCHRARHRLHFTGKGGNKDGSSGGGSSTAKGLVQPPLRFFTDSEKRRRYAPPGFGVPHGANLAQILAKKWPGQVRSRSYNFIRGTTSGNFANKSVFYRTLTWRHWCRWKYLNMARSGRC